MFCEHLNQFEIARWSLLKLNKENKKDELQKVEDQYINKQKS